MCFVCRTIFRVKCRTSVTLRFQNLRGRAKTTQSKSPRIIGIYHSKGAENGGHRTQQIDIFPRFNVAVSAATANKLDYLPKRRKAV